MSPRLYLSFLASALGRCLGSGRRESDGDWSAGCLLGRALGLAPLLEVVLIPQRALELGWPWGMAAESWERWLPSARTGTREELSCGLSQPTLLAGVSASVSEQRAGQNPSIPCNSFSVQPLHPDLFRLWRPFCRKHLGNIRSLSN